GIGPWTADYVAMRALAHPDVFLPTDLGVRRALGRLDPAAAADPSARARPWGPWRSYALQHLWASLGTTSRATTPLTTTSRTTKGRT
ncbi:MAG: DNA-3-methyladenine glycosylase 2 family protein, partial [Actinomycetota bacterium]